jgi:hypothetical protein
MTHEIAILVLRVLLVYGPAAARAVADIFKKETISDADWEKIWAVTEKSYDDYVKPK